MSNETTQQPTTIEALNTLKIRVSNANVQIRDLEQQRAVRIQRRVSLLERFGVSSTAELEAKANEAKANATKVMNDVLAKVQTAEEAISRFKNALNQTNV